MDLELEGQVAVVTGASKGIGLAIVQELVAEGMSVVAGARTLGPLGEMDGVTGVEVDLGSPDGPAALVGEAVARHGRVDVLVNNVGRAPLRLDGFLAVSDADFQASLEISFFSMLRAWGRRASASTRSRPARWRRTCGWVPTASRRPRPSSRP